MTDDDGSNVCSSKSKSLMRQKKIRDLEENFSTTSHSVRAQPVSTVSSFSCITAFGTCLSVLPLGGAEEIEPAVDFDDADDNDDDDEVPAKTFIKKTIKKAFRNRKSPTSNPSNIMAREVSKEKVSQVWVAVLIFKILFSFSHTICTYNFRNGSITLNFIKHEKKIFTEN